MFSDSHWIHRFLNLEPGDLGRGFLVFSYLFLIIASYIIAQAARDALFLDRFDANQLPYGDMAVAVLVGAVVALYIRLATHMEQAKLLLGSLTLFSLTAFFFWWTLSQFRFAWLFYGLYVSVGIFGVLAVTQVWTLANFLFTTREARRLFGHIAGGGIVGGIFGGFLAWRIARLLGTETLLLFVALFLAICVGLVVCITRMRPEGHSDDDLTLQTHNVEGPSGLIESFRLVWASPHLSSIAALICMMSIVTYAAGWQLKAVAEQEFTLDTDGLAAFFGYFNGAASAVALAVQILISYRILQRFGVGLALFVLPVTLALGSLGVLLTGSLVAVTLLKGSEKALRYSLDTAARELLYLPVPSNIKIQVKSFIDTVIWRSGDGLAGATILLFVGVMDFSARQVSWVVLAFLGLWAYVAHRARNQYLESLGHRLEEHRIDSQRAAAPVLDRSTKSILAARLESGDPRDILYALSLFETGYHAAVHPAMRGLIRHESAEVRAKALSLLTSGGDSGIQADVEPLLRDEDPNVRIQALVYLSRWTQVDPLERIRALGDFPEASIRSSVAAFLARPGKAQNLEASRIMLDAMLDDTGPDASELRLEAARLVANFPEAFPDQVHRLIDQRDAELALHAIEGARQLGAVEHMPALISWLGHPTCGEPAAEALLQCRDGLWATLVDHLENPETPLEVRERIPSMLVQIDINASRHILVENLLQGEDASLRFRILDALSDIQRADPETPVDPQIIETLLGAEILGHYRSYQALGALGTSMKHGDSSLQALEESLERELERIFRLLEIQFPDHDLRAAYLGLQSSNSSVRDDSLEFLESLLRPELRSLLLPLMDDSVTLAERIKLADRLAGQEVTTSEEAVRMLIHSTDTWLKSCAVYAIGHLGLTSFGDELEALESSADPLLVESIRQARSRLADIAGGGPPSGNPK